VEVLHASVTSPINNANALATISNTTFCDGAAAGFYNPVVAAVTEAFANGIDRSRIEVLSIGTGTLERPRSEDPQPKGKSKRKYEQEELLQRIRSAAFNDPPDAATYIAHVMLEQGLPAPGSPPPIVNGKIVRMSPALSMATPSEKSGATGGLALLLETDKGDFEQQNVEAVLKLGEAWLSDKVANQAIRANRDFRCEVGHDKASAAIARWQALTGAAFKQGTPPGGATPVAA